MKLTDPTFSTDNPVHTIMAHPDQSPTKVHSEYFFEPLNLHDHYRYHTDFPIAHQFYRNRLYVDYVLASG